MSGETPSSDSPLSAEQVRIVALVAKGRTDAAIARELGMSVSTVKRRLREAARALGVNSRVSLAVEATRRSLIDNP